MVIMALLFFSCAGVPETADSPPSGEESSFSQEELTKQAAYEEVRALIRIASPESLQNAMSRIRTDGLDREARGRELFYVAAKISQLVYPLAFPAREVEVMPQASPFPELFSTALSGNFPDLGGQDASYLSLMVSSLGLIHLSNSFEKRRPAPAGMESAVATVKQLVELDEKSVLPRYLLGLYAEFVNDIEGASFWYQLVLALDEGCYPAQEGMGRSFFLEGKFIESGEVWNKLSEEFPTKAVYRIRAVEAYLAAGERDMADNLLSRLIQDYPDNPDVVTKRPLLLEQYGRFEQANRLLSVLERSYGETSSIILAKARLLLRRNKDQEAIELLGSVQNRFADPFFRAIYEQTLVESGNVEIAQALLERSGEGQLSVSARRALLKDALSRGNWEGAEEQFLFLLTALGQSRELLRNAVTIYQNMGKVDEAFSYANTLKELETSTPMDVMLFTRLLIESERDGSREEAINLIAELKQLSLDPEERSRLLYLESSLAASPEAELELLRSALLEDLQNVEALVAIASLHRQRGDLKKAYRYLSQAGYLAPGNSELSRDLQELEAALGGGEGFLGTLSAPELH